MSFYIIIRGPLGCGKTTIAHTLAKVFDAEYISFDKILEENGLDKQDNNFALDDFIKANKIVLPLTRKELRKGRVVIFDGCFYFKEQIEHLKKNLRAKGYVFTLKASVKTCIGRDRGRSKKYGATAARAVYRLVSRFSCGMGIDTDNKTTEEVSKEILAFLPPP